MPGGFPTGTAFAANNENRSHMQLTARRQAPPNPWQNPPVAPQARISLSMVVKVFVGTPESNVKPTLPAVADLDHTPHADLQTTPSKTKRVPKSPFIFRVAQHTRNSTDPSNKDGNKRIGRDLRNRVPRIETGLLDGQLIMRSVVCQTAFPEAYLGAGRAGCGWLAFLWGIDSIRRSRGNSGD
ncbi:hypothetical protein LX36DRAFT_32027 [Colletotrichum falcatum]|nr:hypothetical protein LX36DRAFT_32027 [Colletotrichum falcatum]